MAHEDEPLSHALGACRAHVVLAEDLEHAGPREAREEGGEVGAEGEAREDQVGERLPDVPGDRLVADDGEEIEPEREQDDEHEAEPEARERQAHQRDEPGRVVDPRIAEGGGEEPGRDPQPDREDEGEGDEGEGRRHPPQELFGDARLVVQRLAEVAVEDPGQPLPVADVEGAVQAELVAELLDGLRGPLAPHHHEGGVPGNHVDEGEGGHAEAEQHGDEGQGPRRDETQDGTHRSAGPRDAGPRWGAYFETPQTRA